MFILEKTYQVVKLGVWSIFFYLNNIRENKRTMTYYVDGIILSCVNV